MARRKHGRRFSALSPLSPRRGHTATTGWAGTLRAQPARPRRRPFQFERLEDRLVMSAGAVVASVIAAPVDPGKLIATPAQPGPRQDAAAPHNSSTPDFPSQFKSAAEFNKWLLDAAVAQWGYLFGRSSYYPQWSIGARSYLLDDMALVPQGGMSAYNNFATNLSTAASANAAISSTNVQVDGVDEADLVETDGNYLYILSGQDLVIVQTGVGDELRIASRVHLDQKPVGMYLSGNRLAIVSTSAGTDFPYQSEIGLGIVAFGYGPAQLYQPTTTVEVLDVTDRSAPTFVQKSQMDGQLVSSRVVDGELRLVLSNSINLPMPIAKPIEGQDPLEPNAGFPPIRFPVLMNPVLFVDGIATDYWQPYDANSSVYETQDEYLARVKDEIFKSAMPKLKTLGADGSVLEERDLTDAEDVYRPDSLFDRSLTTIATFNLSSNSSGPAATTSIVSGSSPQIYATDDSIYLFSSASNEGNYNGIYSSTNATNIQKFAFNPQAHAIRLAAVGRVDGQFSNQFSADETGGYLRVVTSSGWGADGQNLFVLKQVGGQLNVVGSLTGIAAGEQLHAVRFMGDRAFVVTFRRVDPLFAVDLSDPTHPRLAGELTIPGVSGYLQPLDANHLLGVGRAMDSSGQMFGDLELSIFDITNLADPQLSFRYSFDGGWSTTTPILDDSWIPYTGDHHAADYFPDAQIFAMPIFSTQGGVLDNVASTPVFEPGQGGLEVFRVDATAGFTPLAFIEHDMAIERAVEIGDHLFAISSGTVTVHAMADPATQLGELDIAAPGGELVTVLPQYHPPRQTFAAKAVEAAEAVERERASFFGVDPGPQPGRLGGERPRTTALDQAIRGAAVQHAVSIDTAWLASRAAKQIAVTLSSSHRHADSAATDEVFQSGVGLGQPWQMLSAVALADSRWAS
jgi:uncharacterized secreted protein with C-terminal beta-propeller domain